MRMDPILNHTTQNETCDSNNNNSPFRNIKTVKIVHNPTGEAADNSFVRNAMDTYLKKHKLDLTLLPNKKIKLSDLRSSLNHTSDKSELKMLSPQATTTEDTTNGIATSVADANDSMESTEQSENELNDDIDEIQNEKDLNGIIATTVDADDSSALQAEQKRSRKKREPSLKLQQKLSSEDLELIVSNVRSLSANVSIADVKKDNYVDKILKVELLDSDIVLSNGKKEALLKKSMFPRELNTLFDSFVNALCAQKHLLDESGNIKPTLTCLVVDCEYKSFSEAEIMRHIKRHLAQDGYTCSTCSHQFASMTNLQRHLRIHEGNVGKEMKCPECDYKASTITHIKRHMAHKHLERALPCPHCSFMGATNAELKIHMARKHLELTGKNPLFLPKYLRKDYQCSICKEQYNDFKEYQAHMYEHTSSSNRFQCTECPYNCKNHSKLKRHMLYHTGARNYSCELCGNKFFQSEHLKRHMQSIHNIASPVIPTQSIQYNPVEHRAANKPMSSKKQRAGSYPKKLPSSGIARQGPVLTTISNEIESDTGTSCFKVSSRCMYKCHQCDFVTASLFTLNQHVTGKHSRCQDLDSQINSDSFLSDELDAKNLEDNEEDPDDDDDDEDGNESSDLDFKEEHHFFSNHNLNEPCVNEYFLCSFCTYKTDQRVTLKRHLNYRHSSQTVAPILLSNDPIITSGGTRFQCSTCLTYMANVNEFTKHMNERHGIQVYILDLNGETSIQEQLQTKGRAEIMGTSAITDLLQSQMANSSHTHSNTLDQRQQLKNFINSSNSLQARYQNQQHATVRINPLIFKRQAQAKRQQQQQQQQTNCIPLNQSKNAQVQQQQPQQHCSLINNVRHQLVSNGLDNRNQQQQQQQQQPTFAGNVPGAGDIDIDFDNLNETAEQLGIIVNEFQ